MQKYIYEACYTQELDDVINSDSHLKLLVEEMFYRYGLKAYAWSGKSSSLFEVKAGVLMTLDGTPYCKVFVETSWDAKKEIDVLEYCYTTAFASKERGTDYQDRHTWRSSKLSALMRTLDKKKAVPTDFTNSFNNDVVRTLIELVKDSASGTYKSTIDISRAPQIQPLLEYLIDNKPIPADKIPEYKVILDKWKQADENKNAMNNKLNTMFTNEFYIIGENKTDGYVIGSAKLISLEKYEKDEPWDSNATSLFEMVKPFQRVLSLDDYEYIDEIRPMLLMFKVNLEGREQRNDNKYHYDKEGQISPERRFFYDDVGIVTFNVGGDAMKSDYKMLWTAIPTQV